MFQGCQSSIDPIKCGEMRSVQIKDTGVHEHLNVVWYYILARLLLGFGVLVWVLLSVRFDGNFQLPGSLSFYTLGGVFALMGTMAFFSTQHGGKPWFVWLQFIVDALFISMLLCAGSSHHNPFVLLFPLNILAAMSLGWARDVLRVTLLDIICYTCVQYAGYRGYLNWVIIDDSLILYIKVISEIFGLALIGGLGMLMAQQQALTSRNLTEQILTTRRLRRRHIDVLNELPIAIFVTSNSESVRFQLVPQNVLAQNWYAESDFVDQLQQYLHSPQPRRFEFGVQVFQVQRGQLTTEEDLLLVEDVTRMQQLEQTINKEEQLAIIGRMSASLAHEIRNPIASLSGAVQLLAEQKESRLHTIILREINRINELVDLFLQSARSQHLTMEHTSVVSSVLEIVEALQHDPRAQSVEISIKGLSHTPFDIDLAKFRQIVWNLLLNSVQASQDGHITLHSKDVDGQYVLQIADDGKGIPQKDLDKVMDPFFTTRAGGTGLGLFVVQQIVHAHKGTLTIESTEGEGTMVTLIFPI